MTLNDSSSSSLKKTRNYILVLDLMQVLNNTQLFIVKFEKQQQQQQHNDFLFFPPQDLNFTLTANFNGFNTTLYNRQGCGSSTCEGVAILKELHVRFFSFPKESKDRLAGEGVIGNT